MSVESIRRFNDLNFHEMEHKEVVSALIIQEGEVLLMRRAAHETFAGTYELPGGTVEKGETHEQTLNREILEETGRLITTIGALLGVSEFSSQPNVNARNFVYLTEIEPGTIILSEEHDDYCFIDPEEALELPLSENARRALALFSNKRQ